MQKQIQNKEFSTTWERSRPHAFWDKCSPSLQRAIWRTHKIVEEKAASVVEAAHIMLGLLDEVEATASEDADDTKLVQALLTRLGVDRHELRVYTEAFLDDGSELTSDSTIQASEQTRKVFETARSEAQKNNYAQVNLEHLLLALLHPQSEPHLAQALEPLGLTLNSTRFHLKKLQHTTLPTHKGNPLDHLSEGGKHVLDAAHTAMRTTYCGRISTLHLLLGVLAQEESVAVSTLTKCGKDVDELKRATRQAIKHDGQLATPQRKFTAGAKRALERARTEALRLGHQFVSTEYLLLGLLPRTMSPKERLSFGEQVEEDVARVLSTADGELIRRNLLEALGEKDVGKRQSAPIQIKMTKGFVCAFLILFGWTVISTYLASMNSQQDGHLLFAANSLLLFYSALNLLCHLIFSRSQRSQPLSFGVLLGFTTGLVTMWLVHVT